MPRKSLSLKAETVLAYGGQCLDCGETDLAKLQLDHENDNGAAHRRYLLCSNERSGHNFYSALKKLGFPNKEPYLLSVVCGKCHRVRGCLRTKAKRLARKNRCRPKLRA